MKRRNRIVLVARRLVLAPLAALVLVAVAPEANSAAGTPITSCEQVVDDERVPDAEPSIAYTPTV